MATNSKVLIHDFASLEFGMVEVDDAARLMPRKIG
jgi:hypothetical protein